MVGFPDAIKVDKVATGPSVELETGVTPWDLSAENLPSFECAEKQQHIELLEQQDAMSDDAGDHELKLEAVSAKLVQMILRYQGVRERDEAIVALNGLLKSSDPRVVKLIAGSKLVRLREIEQRMDANAIPYAVEANDIVLELVSVGRRYEEAIKLISQSCTNPSLRIQGGNRLDIRKVVQYFQQLNQPEAAVFLRKKYQLKEVGTPSGNSITPEADKSDGINVPMVSLEQVLARRPEIRSILQPAVEHKKLQVTAHSGDVPLYDRRRVAGVLFMAGEREEGAAILKECELSPLDAIVCLAEVRSVFQNSDDLQYLFGIGRVRDLGNEQANAGDVLRYLCIKSIDNPQNSSFAKRFDLSEVPPSLNLYLTVGQVREAGLPLEVVNRAIREGAIFRQEEGIESGSLIRFFMEKERLVHLPRLIVLCRKLSLPVGAFFTRAALGSLDCGLATGSIHNFTRQSAGRLKEDFDGRIVLQSVNDTLAFEGKKVAKWYDFCLQIGHPVGGNSFPLSYLVFVLCGEGSPLNRAILERWKKKDIVEQDEKGWLITQSLLNNLFSDYRYREQGNTLLTLAKEQCQKVKEDYPVLVTLADIARLDEKNRGSRPVKEIAQQEGLLQVKDGVDIVDVTSFLPHLLSRGETTWTVVLARVYDVQKITLRKDSLLITPKLLGQALDGKGKKIPETFIAKLKIRKVEGRTIFGSRTQYPAMPIFEELLKQGRYRELTNVLAFYLLTPADVFGYAHDPR